MLYPLLSRLRHFMESVGLFKKKFSSGPKSPNLSDFFVVLRQRKTLNSHFISVKYSDLRGFQSLPLKDAH